VGWTGCWGGLEPKGLDEGDSPNMDSISCDHNFTIITAAVIIHFNPMTMN
jgi:hypothetical protein